MNEKQKKKIIEVQFYTVGGILASCLAFWVLGGATEEAYAEETNKVEIVIPEYEEEDDGKKDRIASYEEANRLEAKNMMAMKAQTDFNTFEFFNNEEDVEEKEEEKKSVNDDIDARISALENQFSNKNKDSGNKKEETEPVVETPAPKKRSGGGVVSSAPKEDYRTRNKKIVEQKRKELIYKQRKQSFSFGVLVDEDMCFVRELTPEEVAMGFDAFMKAEEEKKKMLATNAPQQTASAPAPAPEKKKSRGFKTMDAKSSNNEKGAIRAVAHGEQKNITTSSQVKLRILDEVEINGVTIPKNTIIYGQARFQNNRMGVHIENIAYNNNVYPFRGTIYDRDGFEGLYVPDNLINDVAKESTSSSISSSNGVSQMSRGIASGNMASTIAGAVRTTAGSIKDGVSNKVREVKITLPANYKLIIKQEQN